MIRWGWRPSWRDAHICIWRSVFFFKAKPNTVHVHALLCSAPHPPVISPISLHWRAALHTVTKMHPWVCICMEENVLDLFPDFYMTVQLHLPEAMLLGALTQIVLCFLFPAWAGSSTTCQRVGPSHPLLKKPLLPNRGWGKVIRPGLRWFVYTLFS